MLQITKYPSNKDTEFNDAVKADIDKENNHDIIKIVIYECAVGEAELEQRVRD